MKFPSASENPISQCIKFLSKKIDFLFDSTTRAEFFNWLHILSSFFIILLNNKIKINKLVGATYVNPWTSFWIYSTSSRKSTSRIWYRVSASIINNSHYCLDYIICIICDIYTAKFKKQDNPILLVVEPPYTKNYL